MSTLLVLLQFVKTVSAPSTVVAPIRLPPDQPEVPRNTIRPHTPAPVSILGTMMSGQDHVHINSGAVGPRERFRAEGINGGSAPVAAGNPER